MDDTTKQVRHLEWQLEQQQRKIDALEACRIAACAFLYDAFKLRTHVAPPIIPGDPVLLNALLKTLVGYDKAMEKDRR